MNHANKLLDEAKAIVLARGEDYGDPQVLFERVARVWSLTLGVEVSAAQVVVCLIELKLARLNGNPTHHDSLVDIAGYAGILNEIKNSNGDAEQFHEGA